MFTLKVQFVEVQCLLQNFELLISHVISKKCRGFLLRGPETICPKKVFELLRFNFTGQHKVIPRNRMKQAREETSLTSKQPKIQTSSASLSAKENVHLLCGGLTFSLLY